MDAKKEKAEAADAEDGESGQGAAGADGEEGADAAQDADAQGVDYGAESEGKARVNGNIFIDGIDVLLAGIYLSLDKKVSVKGADLNVYGTAEDDGISVEVGQEGTADITTGEGDDTVSVTVKDKAGKVSVSTGAGRDKVSLKKSGSASKNADRTDENTAVIDTGEDSDTIDISIDVGDIYKKVEVNGGDQYLMNLSGKLDGDADAGERIKGDRSELVAKNSGGNDITISMNAVAGQKLTDSLTNKPKVEIDLAKADEDENLTVTETGSGENVVRNAVYEAKNPFTDYVFVREDEDAVSINDFASVVVNAGGGLLNNLLLDADNIKEDEIVLRDLIAKDMNLKIAGEEIGIGGVVAAQNIVIEAAAGKEDIDGEKKTTEAIADLASDFFNVSDAARVVVRESGALYAKEDIRISAVVNQSGGLIDITDITDMLNLVNVKVGYANIDISGKVMAGVDYDAATQKVTSIEDASGDIDLSSEVNVAIETGSDFWILSSLAVSVAVVNSGIRIHDAAKLEAGGSIGAAAKSSVEIETSASAGTLPFALGVAVMSNNTHVAVDSASLEARSGDISLSAEGEAKVTTKSDRGSSDNPSGGYFAVDIAVQDVSVDITNSLGSADMKIKAAGDVKINSTARADVTTTAVIPDDNDGSDDDDEKKSTLDYVKDLVRKIVEDVVVELILPDWIDEDTARGLIKQALSMGLPSFDTKYAVKAAPNNDAEKGTVSLSASKAKKGAKLTVSVAPKE